MNHLHKTDSPRTACFISNQLPVGGLWGVRVMTVALAMASASLGAAQTLFGASERVIPGQTFNVTGSGFDPSTRLTVSRYGADGTLGSSQSVTIKNQSEFGLLATLPDNASFGVYKLESSSAAGAGDSLLLNAPRIQWADAKEALPDSTIRLVGRNFRPSTASSPTVRFVDEATGTSLEAIVDSASDYDMTVRVPSGVVAGRSYQIRLNSNIAGSASEVVAPETLLARAKGADPFALGTSWASDFVAIAANQYNLKTDLRLSQKAKGDGVTDDSAALQAAIVYVASKGGGTVYLPAGTYRIDGGTMIQTRSKVVLKGDGIGATVIEAGERYTATVAPPANFYAFQVLGGTNNGFVGMTLRNKSTSASPIGLLRGAAPQDTINRCFLKNVAFESNNGLAVTLGRIREGVVNGCQVTTTATTSGPMTLNGARNLRFTGNSLDYRVGRLLMGVGYRNVIEGNALYINNAYRVPGSYETGGLELSFGQQILASNNRVEGYGPAPTKGPTDGELIMAQRSTVPDYWDAGKVAGVDGLKLFPTDRDWSNNWLSPNHDDLSRSYVAIVRGKGMGQWRRVTSHDAASLTVDKPWTVTPDGTSTYSVGTFVALEQTWIGNNVANGDLGLQLWNGGIDCAMANNVLTNTGPIMVRASSQPAPTAQGTISQCIAWNIDLRDNTLTTTNTRTPASVTVSGFITRPVADREPVGSLVLGVDVLGNRVSGAFFRNTSLPLTQNDGYELVGVQELGRSLDPITNWGTILYGNTVTSSYLNLRLLNVQSQSVDSSLSTLSTFVK